MITLEQQIWASVFTYFLCTILMACGVPEEDLLYETYTLGSSNCCHKNKKGKGHYHHKGWGWGHHKCKDASTSDSDILDSGSIDSYTELDAGVPSADTSIPQQDFQATPDTQRPGSDTQKPEENTSTTILQADSQTPEPDSGLPANPGNELLADLGSNISLDSSDSFNNEVSIVDSTIGGNWSSKGHVNDTREVFAGGCSVTGDTREPNAIFWVMIALMLGAGFRWHSLRSKKIVTGSVIRSKLWLLTVLGLFIAPPAYSEPITTQFKPVIGSHDYWHTQDGKLSLPNISLLYHYENNPLRVIRKPGNALVRRHLTDRHNLDLAIAGRLGRDLELGVSLPIVVTQLGLQDDGGIGDLRLLAKVSLLRRDKYRLAVAAEWAIPTSNVDNVGEFLGFAPKLIISSTYGPVDVALNVGLRIRDLDPNQHQQVTLSVGTRWKALRHKKSGVNLDVVSDLHSAFDLKKNITQEEIPLEWINGVNLLLPHGLAVTAGIGVGLTRGVGVPEYRVLGGLKWAFGRSSCKTCKTKVVRQTRTMFVPIPVPILVKLPSIYFDTDKSEIKDSEKEKLQKITSVLKYLPQITELRLEGHCDYRAKDKYNAALGWRRALQVKIALEELGADTSTIKLISYGELTPLSKKETPAGLQTNRRVDVRIINWDNKKRSRRRR